MRQVGAVQHAIGQRVAEGQQRIERPRMQPVQRLLQEIEHGPAFGFLSASSLLCRI